MNVLDWLYPPKCLICGKVLRKPDKHICQTCKKALPRVVEPCCARCGKPITSRRDEYCMDCYKKRHSDHIDPIRQGTALWEYTEDMRHAIADFKYEGCIDDGVFFGKEMVRSRGEKIKKWAPDYLIPVPIHRKKRWYRGFNQASYIAEEVSSTLGIPLLSDALERVYDTTPQKGLDDKERRANIKNAFRLQDKWREVLRGKRILLIDDIYTTGATVEACAKELKRHGARDIFFACLCIGRDKQ